MYLESCSPEPLVDLVSNGLRVNPRQPREESDIPRADFLDRLDQPSVFRVESSSYLNSLRNCGQILIPVCRNRRIFLIKIRVFGPVVADADKRQPWSFIVPDRLSNDRGWEEGGCQRDGAHHPCCLRLPGRHQPWKRLLLPLPVSSGPSSKLTQGTERGADFPRRDTKKADPFELHVHPP